MSITAVAAVPPPFVPDPDPTVEAEVDALIASGRIRPDEVDIARFLIVSGRQIAALTGATR